MSSIPHRVELDTADLALIRDVLRTGGFRGIEAQENSDVKRAASALLHSEFRNGARTRDALLLILNTNRDDLRRGIPVTGSVEGDAIERWRDEGGQ